MVVVERRIVLSYGSVNTTLSLSCKYSRCLTAYATSLRSIEVGSSSHDDVSPFSVFDEDAFVGSRYRSTFVGYYLKGRAILNRSHAAIE